MVIRSTSLTSNTSPNSMAKRCLVKSMNLCWALILIRGDHVRLHQEHGAVQPALAIHDDQVLRGDLVVSVRIAPMRSG